MQPAGITVDHPSAVPERLKLAAVVKERKSVLFDAARNREHIFDERHAIETPQIHNEVFLSRLIERVRFIGLAHKLLADRRYDIAHRFVDQGVLEGERERPVADGFVFGLALGRAAEEKEDWYEELRVEPGQMRFRISTSVKRVVPLLGPGEEAGRFPDSAELSARIRHSLLRM